MPIPVAQGGPFRDWDDPLLVQDAIRIGKGSDEGLGGPLIGKINLATLLPRAIVGSKLDKTYHSMAHPWGVEYIASFPKGNRLLITVGVFPTHELAMVALGRQVLETSVGPIVIDKIGNKGFGWKTGGKVSRIAFRRRNVAVNLMQHPRDVGKKTPTDIIIDSARAIDDLMRTAASGIEETEASISKDIGVEVPRVASPGERVPIALDLQDEQPDDVIIASETGPISIAETRGSHVKIFYTLPRGLKAGRIKFGLTLAFPGNLIIAKSFEIEIVE